MIGIKVLFGENGIVVLSKVLDDRQGAMIADGTQREAIGESSQRINAHVAGPRMHD